GTPPGFKITGQNLRIEQTSQEIKLSGETFYSDNQGAHSSQENTALSLDGKPTVIGPISLSFRGVDESTFEILSQWKTPGRDLEELSRFSVSADGRTLTETKTQKDKNSASILVFRRT